MSMPSMSAFASSLNPERFEPDAMEASRTPHNDRARILWTMPLKSMLSAASTTGTVYRMTNCNKGT